MIMLILWLDYLNFVVRIFANIRARNVLSQAGSSTKTQTRIFGLVLEGTFESAWFAAHLLFVASLGSTAGFLSCQVRACFNKFERNHTSKFIFLLITCYNNLKIVICLKISINIEKQVYLNKYVCIQQFSPIAYRRSQYHGLESSINQVSFYFSADLSTGSNLWRFSSFHLFQICPLTLVMFETHSFVFGQVFTTFYSRSLGFWVDSGFGPTYLPSQADR